MNEDMELSLSGDFTNLDRALAATQKLLGHVQNATSMTERELNTLERNAETASRGLTRLGNSLQSSATGAQSARRNLASYSGAALATVTALQRLEAQQRRISSNALGTLEMPKSLQGRDPSGQFTKADVSSLSDKDLNSIVQAYARQQETLSSLALRESNRRKQIARDEAAAVIAAQKLKTSEISGRNYNNLSVGIDSAITARASDATAFSSALRARMEEAARASDTLTAGLASTRYALYDVAQTVGIASAAIGVLAVAPVTAAVQFERSFANVQRTSGAAGEQLGVLSDEFVHLAQTLPVPFQDLTDIGALGGQLGIAASGLGSFTSVVAKLTATTDLSAEAAGTALGRFNTLFEEVNPGNFEAVASSILKVGVNSVATETQIVNVATQIASMGDFAGLTVDQVIGLSGALASVGVQPELSRGLITRLFTEMSAAVANGGVTLENFGRVAGMTGDDFKKSWDTKNFAGTFTKFMEGIHNEGGSAVSTLNELGITGVRDVPVLIRLANATNAAGQAGGLLAEQFGYAATGMAEASELSNQYNIISHTTAERIAILANNFQVFLATIGGSTTGPLADFVDFLSTTLQRLTAMADNPVWGAIGTAVIVLGGLTAAFGLASAAALLGLAGYAAVITAMRGIQTGAAGAGVSLKTMNAMLASTGPAGEKAAAGMRLLGAAMKVLSAIGIAMILPDLTRWAAGVGNSVKGIDTSAAGALGRLTGNLDMLRGKLGSPQWQNDINRGMVDAFGSMAGNATSDIKAVDDALAEMARSGNTQGAIENFNRFADAVKQAGGNTNDAVALTPAYNKALSDLAIASADAASGQNLLAGNTDDAIQAELESAEAIATLMGEIVKADQSFVDLGGIWQTVIDKNKAMAESTADSTKTTKDSWEDFYDGFSVNLDEYLGELQKQIDAQNNWETNLIMLSGRASQATIDELRKMGVEGAPLVQALMDGTGEQLARFGGQVDAGITNGADRFADILVNAQPVIRAASGQLSQEAVREITTKLLNGTATVQDIINDYGLVIEGMKPTLNVDSNFNPFKAQEGINDLLRRNDGKSITLYAQWRQLGVITGPPPGTYGNGLGVLKRAGGGPVAGPGSSTSDSIFTRLSNGEYVIKAKAVQQYGRGFLDDINNMRARKFASGGYSGASASVPNSGGQPATQVVELSPYDRMLLERAGNVQVTMDGKVVAQATNANNLGDQRRGK